MAKGLHLVTKSAPREKRDPVHLYLGTLSRSGARAMKAKLERVQTVLNLDSLEPQELSFIALAARAALQDAKAAPATINATISALKGVARAAWQTGQLSADGLQKVRDVRSVRGSRLPSGRAITREEVQAVLEHCSRDRHPSGARDAAIIALQYSLGLRRSECADLEISDYCPTTQTMRVRGKGDKERIAYVVDPGATEALAAWLETRTARPGPLLCPITAKGRIFFRRLTDQGIYDAVVKRGQAAGIANFSPHNLRRSFGTDLLNSGADIIVVKDLLGHSNLNTTKIYDRRGDPAKRKAASLLRLPYQNQQPELPWGEKGQ